MVSFPPPINIITAFLVVFGLSKKAMTDAGNIIYKVAYWFENFFLIFALFMYELALSPIAYFKVFYFCFKLKNASQVLKGILVWSLFGIFFCLFFVLRDVWYFLRILLDFSKNNSMGHLGDQIHADD